LLTFLVCLPGYRLFTLLFFSTYAVTLSGRWSPRLPGRSPFKACFSYFLVGSPGYHFVHPLSTRNILLWAFSLFSKFLLSSNLCSSDFWALGCLIYQMLVGVSPFKAASEYLCFQRILQRTIAWPSDLPPAAWDVIDRLLVRQSSLVPSRLVCFILACSLLCDAGKQI
jgi:serine/threonine protein kinase